MNLWLCDEPKKKENMYYGDMMWYSNNGTKFMHFVLCATNNESKQEQENRVSPDVVADKDTLNLIS